MPRRSKSAPVLHSAKSEPFSSVGEAWIWTMQTLQARRDGARVRAGAAEVARPCEPDDVVKCLERLYRQRRIDLQHARVLRRWGERGEPPSATALSERADRRLWDEAMARLACSLVDKGIVAPPQGAAWEAAE